MSQQNAKSFETEQDILEYISKNYPKVEETDNIELLGIKNAQFGPNFRAKIQSYNNLQCFCLYNVFFQRIKDLPEMKRLQRLEICYSQFDISSLSDITYQYPRLISLRLVGCNITDFSQIECLKGLPDLTQLDLYNNPIYKFDEGYEELHEKIFSFFPKLVYFDNLKRVISKQCTIPSHKLGDANSLQWIIDLPDFSKKQERNKGSLVLSQHTNNSNHSNLRNTRKNKYNVNSEDEDENS